MPDFDFITDEEVREKVENAHKLVVDELTVNFTNAAKEQVDEAVLGLKNKNTELLDEKKNLKDNLKKFDGIDIEVVKTATDFYEKNKDAEFLKDGTVEELIQTKTSQLISDHETAITELAGKLSTATEHGANYQSLFEAKVIDDGLRSEAVRQGVRPEAIEDVILRGRGIFSLDESKLIEARDSDGKLATTDDKKVLTVKNWVEKLKDSSPHYWPGSEGAGAEGGGGGGDSDLTKKLSDLATSGKMDEYRILRDKHKKK
ncbi:MAG: hypothetical protein GY861_14305 [bacterium]|nr:hypothetical protein [bacterium]